VRGSGANAPALLTWAEQKRATGARKGEPRMSYFIGVETAKVSGGANYIRPGVYELEVIESKTGKSPRDQRPFCVVEYKVLSAAPGSEMTAGETGSHLIMMVGNSWLGDVKAMIAAIMNAPAEQVTAPVCDAFFSKNPAKGKRVRARAANKPTGKGGQFTKVTYTAVTA
jgi:hypothetical protein